MTSSMIDTHIRRGSNSRNSRSSYCMANKIHSHHNLKQSVLTAPIHMQRMVAIKITLLCGIAQSLSSSSSKAYRKTKALQVSRGRPARDVVAPLPLQTCMLCLYRLWNLDIMTHAAWWRWRWRLLWNIFPAGLLLTWNHQSRHCDHFYWCCCCCCCCEWWLHRYYFHLILRLLCSLWMTLDIFTPVQDSFWGNFQVPNHPRCSFCFLTPSNHLDGIWLHLESSQYTGFEIIYVVAMLIDYVRIKSLEQGILNSPTRQVSHRLGCWSCRLEPVPDLSRLPDILLARLLRICVILAFLRDATWLLTILISNKILHRGILHISCCGPGAYDALVFLSVSLLAMADSISISGHCIKPLSLWLYSCSFLFLTFSPENIHFPIVPFFKGQGTFRWFMTQKKLSTPQPWLAVHRNVIFQPFLLWIRSDVRLGGTCTLHPLW